MYPLYCWWMSLSEGWKLGNDGTASTAFLSIVSEIFGARKKMMRRFYIRTLERSAAARAELYREFRQRLGPNIIDLDGDDKIDFD